MIIFNTQGLNRCHVSQHIKQILLLKAALSVCSTYVLFVHSRRPCVLPVMSTEGNEVKKVEKSIILPAHPQGLSVLKPADENLPFMLILQIWLVQRGLLNVFFQSRT